MASGHDRDHESELDEPCIGDGLAEGLGQLDELEDLVLTEPSPQEAQGDPFVLRVPLIQERPNLQRSRVCVDQGLGQVSLKPELFNGELRVVSETEEHMDEPGPSKSLELLLGPFRREESGCGKPEQHQVEGRSS